MLLYLIYVLWSTQEFNNSVPWDFQTFHTLSSSKGFQGIARAEFPVNVDVDPVLVSAHPSDTLIRSWLSTIRHIPLAWNSNDRNKRHLSSLQIIYFKRDGGQI